MCRLVSLWWSNPSGGMWGLNLFCWLGVGNFAGQVPGPFSPLSPPSEGFLPHAFGEGWKGGDITPKLLKWLLGLQLVKKYIFFSSSLCLVVTVSFNETEVHAKESDGSVNICVMLNDVSEELLRPVLFKAFSEDISAMGEFVHLKNSLPSSWSCLERCFLNFLEEIIQALARSWHN